MLGLLATMTGAINLEHRNSNETAHFNESSPANTTSIPRTEATANPYTIGTNTTANTTDTTTNTTAPNITTTAETAATGTTTDAATDTATGAITGTTTNTTGTTTGITITTITSNTVISCISGLLISLTLSVMF